MTYVPFPIESKDEDGHTLSLILLSSEKGSYGLHGKGFSQSENINITLSNDADKFEEREIHKVQISHKGTFYESIENWGYNWLYVHLQGNDANLNLQHHVSMKYPYLDLNPYLE